MGTGVNFSKEKSSLSLESFLSFLYFIREFIFCCVFWAEVWANLWAELWAELCAEISAVVGWPAGGMTHSVALLSVAGSSNSSAIASRIALFARSVNSMMRTVILRSDPEVCKSASSMLITRIIPFLIALDNRKRIACAVTKNSAASNFGKNGTVSSRSYRRSKAATRPASAFVSLGKWGRNLSVCAAVTAL